MNISALLIEDNYDLASTIMEYMELDGIKTHHAISGEGGEKLFYENNYDVIILDIMLPRQDGFTTCSNLRKNGCDTPIIMLTAKDTLDDKLTGFKSGSDDYLIKPFAMAELVARVKALALRKSGQNRVLKVGELEMNISHHRLTRQEKELHLPPISWKILEILMREYPHHAAKEKITEKLWGEDCPESNSLKVHMHKLRQLVDKEFSFPMIHTLPGKGFILKTEED